jgi:hypothetical protein
LAICGIAQAQNPPFSSGSTGHEGALSITAPGVTLFDPVAMNLNPVVPGIFNFTTINVAAGSTLKFTENKYHGAVYFLASGDVLISGILDLTGDDGYPGISFASQRIPNAAGSGGFSGGVGGFGTNPALPGNGPGGGAAGTSGQPYGGGGTNTSDQFLVPIIGGSGGGGYLNNGSIGGGGGGALLIASSTTITVNGSIVAHGGNNGGNGGGGGGGGAIRLVSNTIVNGGSADVTGGNGGPGGGGGGGLARFESNNLGGLNVSGPTTRSTPFALNLPSVATPSIKVTSINGMPITSNPFSFPDITINSTAQVPIVVQATNVPIATAVVKIVVFSETGPDQVIAIGPLQGSDASSTATTNITYPLGGSHGYVKATW